MTRKDYTLLSGAINKVYQREGESVTLDEIIRELSLVLKQDNPAFKPEVFTRFCKLQKG